LAQCQGATPLKTNLNWGQGESTGGEHFTPGRRLGGKEKKGKTKEKKKREGRHGLPIHIAGYATVAYGAL